MTSSPKIDSALLERLMTEALKEASQAATQGEVPVGAVLWDGKEIIARAHNLSESLQIPSAHAEGLVIDAAAKKLKRWRLDDLTLVVTLEPCTMCAGLIRQARISTVVFGAADERAGACGSLFDILSDPRLGEPSRVIRGVMAEPSAKLLKEFFDKRRKSVK